MDAYWTVSSLFSFWLCWDSVTASRPLVSARASSSWGARALEHRLGNCSVWASLPCSLWDLGSLTRDRTGVPCIGSRIPKAFILLEPCGHKSLLEALLSGCRARGLSPASLAAPSCWPSSVLCALPAPTSPAVSPHWVRPCARLCCWHWRYSKERRRPTQSPSLLCVIPRPLFTGVTSGECGLAGRHTTA